MARNIEIKAHIHQLAQVEAVAKCLSDTDVTLIEQEDIFFPCPTGRLKLRVLSSSSGQLIFYRRNNQTGPKTSTYEFVETNSPDELRSVLAAAYGEAIIVKKLRRLYLTGRTRIHIDSVEGLGNFLELEVVLRDEEKDIHTGEMEARELMAALGVKEEDLIDVAYADLLSEIDTG